MRTLLHYIAQAMWPQKGLMYRMAIHSFQDAWSPYGIMFTWTDSMSP